MCFVLEYSVNKPIKPSLMLNRYPTEDKFSLGVLLLHLGRNRSVKRAQEKGSIWKLEIFESPRVSTLALNINTDTRQKTRD